MGQVMFALRHRLQSGDASFFTRGRRQGVHSCETCPAENTPEQLCVTVHALPFPLPSDPARRPVKSANAELPQARRVSRRRRAALPGLERQRSKHGEVSRALRASPTRPCNAQCPRSSMDEPHLVCCTRHIITECDDVNLVIPNG